MPTNDDLSPLAPGPLGRVPTGLYVVSTLHEGRPLGFVGSFLVQVAFAPPAICVAIGRGRAHLAAIRAAGHFAVSILDGLSTPAMGAFFKKYSEGETAFDHLPHEPAPGGAPVLSQALAWLDCRVAGEHDAGDHVVVFGEVREGGVHREGEPSVHLRKNGLAY